MENIKAEISAVLMEIEQISESFYQQKINEGYQRLVIVIDSLTKITDYLSSVERGSEIIEKNNRVVIALNEAIEAMLNKDTILLSDIFKYDVSDVLEELLDINID